MRVEQNVQHHSNLNTSFSITVMEISVTRKQANILPMVFVQYNKACFVGIQIFQWSHWRLVTLGHKSWVTSCMIMMSLTGCLKIALFFHFVYRYMLISKEVMKTTLSGEKYVRIALHVLVNFFLKNITLAYVT